MTIATPPPSPTRLINPAQSEYIDIVRGIAAQLVLAHHAVAYCLPDSRLDALGGGALGVLAFFLLSGFLITDTICSRVTLGRFSLTEFTVSRFSRIYLPYIPAILLVAVLDSHSAGSRFYEYAADYTWPTAVANASMLQDYPLFQVLRRLGVPDQPWFFKTFGSGRQFWTVSIEWWIYLAVGFSTFLVLRRRRPSPWMWLVLGFLLVEPLYNLVGGPGDCLTLAWLFGASASLAYRRVASVQTEQAPQMGAWIAAWLALAVLAGTRLFFTHGRIYDAVFALLFAGLLFLPMLMLLGREDATMLRRLGLGRLSFHSYSLYLTHGSVVLFLLAQYGEGLRGWAGLAAVIIVCNAAAVPFAFAFESPHRRVRGVMLQALSSSGKLRRGLQKFGAKRPRSEAGTRTS